MVPGSSHQEENACVVSPFVGACAVAMPIGHDRNGCGCDIYCDNGDSGRF